MAEVPKESPLREVQVDALVVMRIIKHSSQNFPTVSTGALVGMDINGTLEVTNSFPFPHAADASSSDNYNDGQNQAAAAPRSKANHAYQNEMLKFLREVNVDAQNVGWYLSTNMGNFVNLNTIENQFFYQKEANERTVTLVYDVSRSSQGSLSLKAYRLSAQFIAAYKESKFTTESLQKSGLRYQDIFTELPVTVHNSHLLTSYLHQLPTAPPKQAKINFPPSLAALNVDPQLTEAPLAPNFESLDLSIDPFLEKTCDLLLESIESHHTELNNYQYYQRSLQREQAKITQWQSKRKAENAQRAISKQPALPEDEWQKLFKLPTEPSRLETLLNSRQVEQYARQVDGFTAAVSSKMFAVKSNLLPGDE